MSGEDGRSPEPRDVDAEFARMLRDEGLARGPGRAPREPAAPEDEDGPGRFDQITVAGGKGTNPWFNVIRREGRYRLVRRLWASQGVEVSRLVRVRFGPVPLPGGIKAGRYQEMTPVQVSALAQAVGLKR